MGRKSEKKTVEFSINGKSVSKDVETFTWEKLDCVEQVKNEFHL